MKLNVAYPANRTQKKFEVEDDKKLKIFYEKRMAQEVPADALGEEWKGYVLRITGGNDKQGFPMKQGVMTTERVRLLLSKGQSCYRPRRDGERRRKSVRGCIVDSNLSVLSLVVVKKGEGDIEGLTDRTVSKRLAPKRASKVRKMLNLDKHCKKDELVAAYREFKKQARENATDPKEKKHHAKVPKIQRLVTPARLQRKKHRVVEKMKRREKRQEEIATYHEMLREIQEENKKAKEEKEQEAKKVKKATEVKKVKKATEEKKAKEAVQMQVN